MDAVVCPADYQSVERCVVRGSDGGVQIVRTREREENHTTQLGATSAIIATM